jgi:molecular chaperone GrpE (heat shock protein)
MPERTGSPKPSQREAPDGPAPDRESPGRDVTGDAQSPPTVSKQHTSVPAREEPEFGLPGEIPPAAIAPPLTEEEEGYLAQLQRLQAEFANYRKRTMRERADWDIRAKGELVAGLIPILDDLARARETHAASTPSTEAEGLLLILARFEEVLTTAGLEKQATAAGTSFDPHIHEALAGSPSEDYPEGTIIETLEPGFLFRSQLLRPARVRVSQGPSGAVS